MHLGRHLLCALACFGALAAPPAQARSNAMVHQKGLDIVDGQGTKIKLKSVNLAPWLNLEGYLLGGSQLSKQTQVIERLEQLLGKPEAERLITELRLALVTKDDIKQIAAHGFNCVRVPVNYRQINTDTDPGWKLLDQLSEWCNEYKIYIILDLHAAPGGQSRLSSADPEVPNLWQSKTKQEDTVKLWSRIATHFKNNVMVAGYDILNEPQADDSDKLIDLNKRIIKAIREADPDHMIIIEGVKFSGEFSPFTTAPVGNMAFSDFAWFTKPLDRNMVYSFHMYSGFGDDRARRLAAYGGVAHAQHVPMWVGELGENNYEMIDSTLKMLAASDYIAGWSMWTWKRAAVKYPNLNVIEIPPSWKATIDWVGNPFKKRPTQQEGIEGMEQLIKAAAIQNAVPDKKLMEIVERY
jgi:endoglucanase